MLRSAISFHFPGESPQTAHDISLESIRGNKVAIEINKKTNHQFILKLFFRDTRITKWEEKTKFPLPILFHSQYPYYRTIHTKFRILQDLSFSLNQKSYNLRTQFLCRILLSNRLHLGFNSFHYPINILIHKPLSIYI